MAAAQRASAARVVCAEWGLDDALPAPCRDFLGWCGTSVAHAEEGALGPAYSAPAAGAHARGHYDSRFAVELVRHGVLRAKWFAARLPAVRKEVAEVVLRPPPAGTDERVDPAAVAEALLVFLGDQWSATRKLAAAAAAALLPDAAAALTEPLTARLASAEWWVVDGAALALQKLFAGGRRCLPLLPPAPCSDEDVARCEEAAEATGLSVLGGAASAGLQPVSEALVAAATGALTHSQESVRAAAAGLLTALARRSPPLPLLRFFARLVCGAGVGEGTHAVLRGLLPSLPRRCDACVYATALAGTGSASSIIRQAAAETLVVCVAPEAALAARLAADAAALPPPTAGAWERTEGLLFAVEELALKGALPAAVVPEMFAWAARLPTGVFEVRRMRSQALPHLARAAVQGGLVGQCRYEEAAAAAGSFHIQWVQGASGETAVDGEAFFWIVWSARLLGAALAVDGLDTAGAAAAASPVSPSPQLQRFADPCAGLAWWTGGASGDRGAASQGRPGDAAPGRPDFWSLCARLAYRAYFPSAEGGEDGVRGLAAGLLQWVRDERAPGVLCRVLPDAVPHCTGALPELVDCVAQLIERESLIDVKVALNLLEALRRLAVLINQALALRQEGGSGGGVLSPLTRTSSVDSCDSTTASFPATPVLLHTLTESTRAAWGAAHRPAVTVTLLNDAHGLLGRSSSSWTVAGSPTPSPTKHAAAFLSPSPRQPSPKEDDVHVVSNVHELDVAHLATALHAAVGVCCSVVARKGAEASICKAALRVLLDSKVRDCRTPLLNALAKRLADEGFVVSEGCVAPACAAQESTVHDWDMSSDEDEEDGGGAAAAVASPSGEYFMTKWEAEVQACLRQQVPSNGEGDAAHEALAAYFEALRLVPPARAV